MAAGFRTLARTEKKRIVMTALAKKKINIPSLQERAAVLFEEILDAPADEAVEVIKAWQAKLDEALGAIAERTRPEGIPVGWIRMQIDIKGRGPCPCRAYAKAIEE
jgi:hypothetical protein